VAIVAALVARNIWLFPPIALGGTILGYLAALGAIGVFEVVDIRWLRLGRSEDAWILILLLTGPAVALLVAVLVLNFASDLVLIDAGGLDALSGFISSFWDIVRPFLGAALVLTLVSDLFGHMQGN